MKYRYSKLTLFKDEYHNYKNDKWSRIISEVFCTFSLLLLLKDCIIKRGNELVSFQKNCQY
jgi:hypothetical protein